MLLRDLFDKFFTNYVEVKLKPNTVRGYKVNIYQHILPFLGDLPSDELTYDHIDDLVSSLRDKGLNHTTIKYVLAVFRKCLGFAVKRGYLPSNILLQYDLPKSSDYLYKVLNENQITKLCHYLEDDDIYPCVLLASCYGMRKGEILGLQRSDLVWNEDLQQYIVNIRRSVVDVNGIREVSYPKTNSSIRSVLLSPRHSERLLRYICLRHIEPNDYICTRGSGLYITNNSLNYRFKLALSALNFPSVRFHDLRHSYATFMLKNGIHPKIISSVLGHSSVKTTLDIYSHFDVSMQKICVDVVDKM